MKGIWLARRDDWSRLITPISDTRAVFTLGARSHQSNLAQPKGKSEPIRGFSTSLRSGNVIMKATGSPSSSATCIRSSKAIDLSFLPVRSEERRVGKEGGSTGRLWVWPYH